MFLGRKRTRPLKALQPVDAKGVKPSLPATQRASSYGLCGPENRYAPATKAHRLLWVYPMLNHPGVTGRKSGNPAIDDPIYTEAEMAERLRVSVFTLRRWRKAGKIAFIQLTQRTIGYETEPR